jgi:hypothetical protein
MRGSAAESEMAVRKSSVVYFIGLHENQLDPVGKLLIVTVPARSRTLVLQPYWNIRARAEWRWWR